MDQCRKMQFNIKGEQMHAVIEDILRGLIRPNGPDLCGTYGDLEHQEANAFLGLSWDAVTCDIARANWEAVYWFTPEAFKYYFFALVRCSLIDKKSPSLYVGSLLQVLSTVQDGDEGLRKWQDNRVQEFNAHERSAILAWLDLIERRMPEESKSGRINEARQTLGQWPI